MEQGSISSLLQPQIIFKHLNLGELCASNVHITLRKNGDTGKVELHIIILLLEFGYLGKLCNGPGP